MARITAYTDGVTPADTDYHVIARAGRNFKLLWSALKSKATIGAHGAATQIGAGNTVYLIPFISGFTAVTLTAAWPTGGVLANLYVNTSSAQPGTGSLVATLVVNAVDSALVVTIPAGSAAGTFTDTTHSVTIVAGDRLRWKFVNNAATDSAAVYSCIMTIS